VTFQSILFECAEDKDDRRAAPAFLADLNLDQVINAVTAGKGEYDLKPFFYCTLRHRDAIEYRHDIMRDLEKPALFERVNAFAQNLRAMRRHLAQAEELRHRHQQEAWFLDAVEIYCDAVGAFAKDLATVDLESRGFAAWRDYLTAYAESPRFKTLLADTNKLKAELAAVKYCVLIKGSTVKVRKCASETDYGAEIEETFAKFKRGPVKDERAGSSSSPDMNHIEAKLLDFVVKLYPGIFRRLDEYCEANGDYPDETVTAFDREIQFYLAWLDYAGQLKNAGLQFCYPRISDACTVSMTSGIVAENPALRTYKIVRRPADGLAYAMAIAEKYRLTYECVKERVKP
jgi:hypothetical protein